MMKTEYLRIQTEHGELYGGNQSMFGWLRSHSGCGMIAACDMALYLSGRRTVPEEEYRKIILESNFYHLAPRLFGIPSKAILRYLDKHTEGHAFQYIPRRKLTEGRLTELAARSLAENVPIIVRIGLNGRRLKYKISFPYNGRKGHGCMSWHYVTITGLENGTAYFSSWGGMGEMSIADLEQNMGLFGGVISSRKITCPSDSM